MKAIVWGVVGFLGLLGSALQASESFGYGTAFFISHDGYLLTNQHVVKGATSIEIRYQDKWQPAEIVRQDPQNDVAILKTGGEGYSCIPVQFGADVRSGDSVFTVGFPDPTNLGFAPKTTRGEISALSGLKDDPRFFQITAAIQPGNSGGPLCDGSGNVIGITVATVNPFRAIGEAGYIPQNVNYGVKAFYARPLIDMVPNLSGKLEKPKTIAEFRRAQEGAERSVVSVRVAASTRPSADVDYSNRMPEGSPEQDRSFAESSLFRSIKEMEKKEDFFGMLETSKRATEQFPLSALAHRALSDTYWYLEMFQESVTVAHKAIDLAPDNARGWNNLAMLYDRLNDKDKAKATYVHALKLAPGDAKLMIEYAEMISHESPDTAYSALNKAKALLLNGQGTDPETAGYDLQTDLVSALIRLGRKRDAYETAIVFRDKAPSNAKSWVAYARAAYAEERFAEVQPALMEASRLDHDCVNDAGLYVLLGRAVLNQNAPTSAVSWFKKALKFDAKHVGAMSGIIYARLDEAAAAGSLSRDAWSDIEINLRNIAAVSEDQAQRMRDNVSADLARIGLKWP